MLMSTAMKNIKQYKIIHALYEVNHTCVLQKYKYTSKMH
jgi:hypothetical protein